MSSTWKAAIGVILVFILGWAGGVVTTIAIARHKALDLVQGGPEAVAVVLERRTTRDLGLTEDQKTQLHALFVENVKQRMELQKQIQPQVHAVNRQTLQEIDALLTPDQQQHFHDNLVLFKDRYGKNPFSVGSGNTANQTNSVPQAGWVTNTSATNAPPATQ